MDERSITLSTELAAAVDDAVSAGEYGSTSEAVSDAVREWKERRENFGYSIGELRKLVQDGIDSGPSRYVSMDEIIAAAHRRHQERTAS